MSRPNRSSGVGSYWQGIAAESQRTWSIDGGAYQKTGLAVDLSQASPDERQNMTCPCHLGEVVHSRIRALMKFCRGGQDLHVSWWMHVSACKRLFRQTVDVAAILGSTMAWTTCPRDAVVLSKVQD